MRKSILTSDWLMDLHLQVGSNLPGVTYDTLQVGKLYYRVSIFTGGTY